MSNSIPLCACTLMCTQLKPILKYYVLNIFFCVSFRFCTGLNYGFPVKFLPVIQKLWMWPSLELWSFLMKWNWKSWDILPWVIQRHSNPVTNTIIRERRDMLRGSIWGGERQDLERGGTWRDTVASHDMSSTGASGVELPTFILHFGDLYGNPTHLIQTPFTNILSTHV